MKDRLLFTLDKAILEFYFCWRQFVAWLFFVRKRIKVTFWQLSLKKYLIKFVNFLSRILRLRPANEFNDHLDMDMEVLLYGSPKQKQKYTEDLIFRRELAHREDLVGKRFSFRQARQLRRTIKNTFNQSN